MVRWYKTDVQNRNLKGKVRFVHEIEYAAHMDNGKLVKNTQIRDELLQFDKEGFLLSDITYSNHSKTSVRTRHLKYSKAHKLQEDITYDSTGQILSKISYEYDKEGFCKREITTDREGERLNDLKMKYSFLSDTAYELTLTLENGKQIITRVFFNQDSLVKRREDHGADETSTHLMNYDDKKQLISDVVKVRKDTSRQEKIWGGYFLEYDEHGGISRQISKRYKEVDTVESKYIYDSHLNYTYMEMKTSPKPYTTITERVIGYYE